MLLGYDTNGLAHHDPLEAVELLAEIGYRSVAITIDHGTLNPRSAQWRDDCRRMRDALERWNLQSVIETGAHYLLSSRVKHEPTLMTHDPAARAVRIGFLCRAVDIAEAVGSRVVSLWSGVLRDDASDEEALERLASGLKQVLDYAAERQIVLAFEPAPGMFIDTTSRFDRLLHWVDAPCLKLTLDLGHLYCQGEVPIADFVARYQPRLANVHIGDMRAGQAEHLMFGEGEMDFPPIIAALQRASFHGGVHVELNRHSHEGPAAARQAFDFLAPLIRD